MRMAEEMRVAALRQASLDAGAGAPGAKVPGATVVSRAEVYLAFLLNGRGGKRRKRNA